MVAAIVTAASFAVAGPFGKALADGGWTPVAVAGVRTGVAAMLLLGPAVVLWRAEAPDRALRRAWIRDIAGYGLLGVAGVQLCFYVALQYAAVAPVLLIEFLAPLLLVGWVWLTRGEAPSHRVALGAVLAMLGMVLVVGTGGGSVGIGPLGAAWALAAACCLACYFHLAESHPGRPSPHPLVLAGGGLGFGSLVCIVLGATGLMTWRSPAVEVPLAGTTAPWWAPLLGLAIFAGVVAYCLGVVAVRLLASRRASFLGLTEVIFAALMSWILLGEQPLPVQAVGAVVVLAGIALVQTSASPAPTEPAVEQHSG